MALGTSVQELIGHLGHDGANGKGHHIQELVDFCYNNEIAVTRIDADPYSEYRPDFKVKLWETDLCVSRLEKYLHKNYGVLIGRVGPVCHAIAWDGENIHDPAGELKNIEEFLIESFYMLHCVIVDRS